MDIADAARHVLQKDYAYFKVNHEKNEADVKRLLDVYDIWSNHHKRDVIDFDELYQDLTLKKSVDAFIGKAFSLAISETKISSEEVADQIKNSIKGQASGEIKQNTSINHHVHEKYIDLRMLHKNEKDKGWQHDSLGDKNQIQPQIPNISKFENIKSQINVTSQTASGSRVINTVKSREKDELLKSKNEPLMPVEYVKSKLITPKKDLSSKWNICKQTNSSNEVAQCKTQQLNEKTGKIVHHIVNFDESSDRVYGHACPALFPMNSNQGNSISFSEQYKHQFIKGNKNILYYPSEPHIAMKNQASIGLTPGYHCDWQPPDLFYGQNNENIHFKLAREESDPLCLPYPMNTNYFTTTSSTYKNISHMGYQLPPSDYFNWNTEGHLCHYDGENMNQPHNENMYFWDPQNTVTWDFQNYPIASGLENDFERRHELLQNYGGYFKPAEAILQSRLRLDNSSGFVQP